MTNEEGTSGARKGVRPQRDDALRLERLAARQQKWRAAEHFVIRHSSFVITGAFEFRVGSHDHPCLTSAPWTRS
jgi:hypothetical protein